MKKLFSIFLLPLVVFAISCQREVDSPRENSPSKEKKLVFTDVGVSLSPESMDGNGSSQQEQTKSYLTIAVEDIFDGAALFAFYKESGDIIRYEDGSPVTLTTTEKTFSWRLPLNVDMKVYTLVNYKGNITADIASMLQNPNLTTTDLDAVSFTCESGTALKEMETKGYGLPMAGITDCKMTPTNSSLNIAPKRLFAKYLVYFDKSELVNAGYEVNSLYISASRSNTVVPVFTEGYGQTNPSLLKPVDLGSGSDLIELNMASKEHAVALYFLENCQGNMGNLSNWYEVASASATVIPRKNLCSYIDLGIKASTAEGDQNFIYWVFLGDDCKTNFDIRRNTTRYLKINLHTPEVVPPTQGLLIAGEPNSVVDAQYPNNGSLYFETSLPQDQILLEKSVTGGEAGDVSVSIASFGENEKQLTAYAYSGYITVHPEANKNFSTKVTAGKKNGTQWIVSGEKIVTFTEQDVVVSYEYSTPVISFSANPTSIGVSGGQSALSASVSYTRTPVYKSGNKGTVENLNDSPTISLVGSANGFTRNGMNVSVGANSTFSSRSVTYRAIYTIPGTSTSAVAKDVTITQSGQTDGFDHYEYSNLSVTIDANNKSIPGTGGSSTLSYSASYKEISVSKSGIRTEQVKNVEPTISGSATGFTRNGKNVSVSENPSYTSSRSVTYTATLNLGSGTPHAKSASSSVTITQAAKNDVVVSQEYSEQTITVSANPTSIVHSGGQSTITASATYKVTDVYASGQKGNSSTQSATVSLSISGTGFSLSNKTVTVQSNPNHSSRTGTVTAEATINGKKYSNSCTITQEARPDDITYRITRVVMSPSTIEWNSNSTATVYRQKYVNGSKSGSEETIANSNFNWGSSNSSIATVNTSGVASSKSTNGSANITATLKSTSGYESGYTSASASLTVSHTPVETYVYSVSINRPSTSIPIDGTTTFSATLMKQKQLDGVNSGSPVQESASFTWSSSNTGVATVNSSSGLVRGVNTGSANITATCSKASGSAPINVTYKDGFEWIDGNFEIEAGTSKTVSYRYSGDASISSDLDIQQGGSPTSGANGYQYTRTATVTSFKTTSVGNHSITGSAGGKTATIVANVTAAPSYSLSITPGPTAYGYLGDAVAFKAILTTTRGSSSTETDVTSSATWNNVSGLSRNGSSYTGTGSTGGSFNISCSYSVAGETLNASRQLILKSYITTLTVSNNNVGPFEVGSSVQLTARYKKTKDASDGYAVVEDRDVTNEATWTTDGSGNYWVSKGLVTGNNSNRKSGTSAYKVTATYNGKSADGSVGFVPHSGSITITATGHNTSGSNWIFNVVSSSAVPESVSGYVTNSEGNHSTTFTINKGQSIGANTASISGGSGGWSLVLTPTSYFNSSTDVLYNYVGVVK